MTDPGIGEELEKLRQQLERLDETKLQHVPRNVVMAAAAARATTG